LANADSPTNLSWLINNSGIDGKKEDKQAEPPLEFGEIDGNGTSFKEFALSLEARPEHEDVHA
jgi:hypothetical protein